jgi:hypothetical protein
MGGGEGANSPELAKIGKLEIFPQKGMHGGGSVQKSSQKSLERKGFSPEKGKVAGPVRRFFGRGHLFEQAFNELCPTSSSKPRYARGGTLGCKRIGQEPVVYMRQGWGRLDVRGDFVLGCADAVRSVRKGNPALRA